MVIDYSNEEDEEEEVDYSNEDDGEDFKLKGSCVIKCVKGHVQDPKLTVVRLQRLFAGTDCSEVVDFMFDCIGFSNDSIENDRLLFQELFLHLNIIYPQLNDLEKDWDVISAAALQVQFDAFLSTVRTKFNLTNYLLDFHTGVVHCFLIKYVNLTRYKNQNLEYVVGKTRSFGKNRCNNKLGQTEKT